MATFVVCHGAWSAGWAWKKVRPLLRAAGHEVFTPTYTGLGERAHQVSRAINLDTHIADVLGVLECEDLRDVVLLGHSYGGMVATGVADRAAERIAKLVYLDAFVPENGQSLFDLLPAQAARRRAGGRPRQRRRLAAAAQPVAARHLARGPGLDHAAPPLAADRLLRAAAAFSRAPAPHLPRTYIYCTRTPPDDTFGQFAKRFRADPAWQFFELDASHSPNVTAPAALAQLIDRIAR